MLEQLTLGGAELTDAEPDDPVGAKLTAVGRADPGGAELTDAEGADPGGAELAFLSLPPPVLPPPFLFLSFLPSCCDPLPPILFSHGFFKSIVSDTEGASRQAKTS